MEINQLRYFVTIVESNFNISTAAKKLYTSQSSISQVILNVERESNSLLFVRERGRLRSLTPFGQYIYQESIKILDIYDAMMAKINEGVNTQTGVLKVGIPELIVKVYLEDTFLKFIKENTNIRLEVVEIGSKDIAAMLEKNALDFAILVEPTLLNPAVFNNQRIIHDELYAYMSKNHELADHEKLTWDMLEKADLALFHTDFITHHLVTDKLKANGLKNKEISLTSSSWTFLIDMCLKNNMVTLLASKVKDQDLSSDLVAIPFENPIPFDVSVWSHKRDRKIQIEEDFKENLYKITDVIN